MSGTEIFNHEGFYKALTCDVCCFVCGGQKSNLASHFNERKNFMMGNIAEWCLQHGLELGWLEQASTALRTIWAEFLSLAY